MLKDISFHVEPGQTVGIIGATGSGKSSLINLICRFYDVNQGRVLVDDIDVRNLNLQSFAEISELRCRMSFCSQIQLREISLMEIQTVHLSRCRQRQRLQMLTNLSGDARRI